MKHFIYKSKFKRSLTEWAKQELNEHQYNILYMLYNENYKNNADRFC